MKSKNIIEINIKYLPPLSKMFNPIVLNDITLSGTSSYLTEVFKYSGLLKNIDLSMSIADFFNLLHKTLLKHYKNEYIYKNIIANKVLLGRHSVNTAHMLTEFRANQCKADVVILNGTSTVYEIKSEYDNFSRLEKQMTSYLNLFDHINVITSPLQVDKISSFIPESVGILLLTKTGTIKSVRNSKSNIHNIKLESLFASLRQPEYLSILQKYYGFIPNVPNTQIFNKCRSLYMKIPLEIAHNLTVDCLKNRKHSSTFKNFIAKLPVSLKAYGLTICNDNHKMSNFLPRLNASIESVLIQ